MALNDPSFWQNFGSGGVAGVIAAGAAAMTRRSGRLARLERAVEDCRRRDADVIVLTASFRLVVGALSREVPQSLELRMCRDLLNKHLPLRSDHQDLTGLEDLIEALDRIPDPKPKEF